MLPAREQPRCNARAWSFIVSGATGAVESAASVMSCARNLEWRPRLARRPLARVEPRFGILDVGERGQRGAHVHLRPTQGSADRTGRRHPAGRPQGVAAPFVVVFTT